MGDQKIDIKNLSTNVYVLSPPQHFLLAEAILATPKKISKCQYATESHAFLAKPEIFLFTAMKSF